MQLLRFAVVGLMNTLIDFGVLNGLLWLDGYSIGWQLFVYNALAFSAANGNSYLLNKWWTFGDSRPVSSGQVGLFFFLTLVGMTINSSIVFFLTTSSWFPQTVAASIWVNLAKVVATLASMIWNYCSYRWWVFDARPPGHSHRTIPRSANPSYFS